MASGAAATWTLTSALPSPTQAPTRDYRVQKRPTKRRLASPFKPTPRNQIQQVEDIIRQLEDVHSREMTPADLSPVSEIQSEAGSRVYVSHLVYLASNNANVVARVLI